MSVCACICIELSFTDTATKCMRAIEFKKEKEARGGILFIVASLDERE